MPITPLAIKIAAFTIAILPLLVENWRKGTASNRSNAILLVGGLAFAGWQLATGALHPSFGLFGGWLAVLAGAVALVALNIAPGGVAKTFAALAPWMGPWQVLAVVAVSMIGTAVIGFTRRKPIGIALPVWLVTCALWLAVG